MYRVQQMQASVNRETIAFEGWICNGLGFEFGSIVLRIDGQFLLHVLGVGMG